MTSTTSKVLSLRMDGELFDRLHEHAAKRGMSVQDYVVRTLVRDDFDERFHASVEEAERLYGPGVTVSLHAQHLLDRVEQEVDEEAQTDHVQ